MAKKSLDDSVIEINKNNKLNITIHDLVELYPLTDNQAKFFNLYNKNTSCIGLFGCPGVGKSFLSLYKALEEVLERKSAYKKVVVVRSAVQTRDQGYVPGTLEEKSMIYEAPYVEASSKLFQKSDAWQRLKEQKYVQFITTTAIRGITLDDSIIIVDECQSMTWHELSSIITRVGKNSKIIFSGDLKQNDLIKNKNDVSGLSKFINVMSNMKEFKYIDFTSDDIVRGSLVKSFIVACEKLGY